MGWEIALQPIVDFSGGVMDNLFAERQAQRDFERERQLMYEQWTYNHPNNVGKRLQEAGLNKALAYGHGSIGGASGQAHTPASKRTGNMASTRIPHDMAMMMQARSQVDLNESLSNKADEEANLAKVQANRIQNYGPVNDAAQAAKDFALAGESEERARLTNVNRLFDEVKLRIAEATEAYEIGSKQVNFHILQNTYQQGLRDLRQADWEYLFKNPLELQAELENIKYTQSQIIRSQVEAQLAQENIYLTQDQRKLLDKRINLLQQDYEHNAGLYEYELQEAEASASTAKARQIAGISTGFINSFANLGNAAANVISSVYGLGSTSTITKDLVEEYSDYDKQGNLIHTRRHELHQSDNSQNEKLGK